MTNLQALILSKLAPKHVREAEKPGEYEINMFVNVTGIFKIGDPYFTTPTAQLPILAVMGAMLAELDAPTRERCLHIIEKKAEYAHENDLKLGEVMSQKVSAMIEKVRARFRETLPQVEHNGKCTFKNLEITVH